MCGKWHGIVADGVYMCVNLLTDKSGVSEQRSNSSDLSVLISVMLKTKNQNLFFFFFVRCATSASYMKYYSSVSSFWNIQEV